MAGDAARPLPCRRCRPTRGLRHLAPGDHAGDPAALLAGGSLPAVWAARLGAPTRRARSCRRRAGRWWTAGRRSTERTPAAARPAGRGRARRRATGWCGRPATSLDAVVACLAALRLGAVVVPVNAAYTERELAHVVGRRAAGGWRWSTGRSRRRGWPRRPGRRSPSALPRPRRSAGGPPPGRPAGAAAGPRPVGPGRPGADRLHLGHHRRTEGGGAHPRQPAGRRRAPWRLAWRWAPDDRLVLALPALPRPRAVRRAVRDPGRRGVGGGARAVLAPTAVLDAAGEHGRHALLRRAHHVPPTGRVRPGGRAGPAPPVRVGSAPLPAPLWQRVRDRRRGGGARALRHDRDAPHGLQPLRRRAAAGHGRVPAARGRGPVGGPDGGRRRRCCVRGPSVFAGYWERPAATAEAFDDGWFRTGDVVDVDADGYLAIRGRPSDLIISGGFNVYPAEVEDVLLGPSRRWPRWRSSACRRRSGARPSSPGWCRPTARGRSAAALAEFAAARLAPYKRPRRSTWSTRCPATRWARCSARLTMPPAPTPGRARPVACAVGADRLRHRRADAAHRRRGGPTCARPATR